MGGTLSNKHNFKFEVDLNVINHLGVGLYSSTPAALTELVANSWDADAQNVWITVDPTSNQISIEDDGHGMSAEAIEKKFLHVGYSRRRASGTNFSQSGKRRVMGRKGIGKLSMFALSNFVRVSSKSIDGDLIGFEVDVPALKKDLQDHNDIVLNEFDPSPLRASHGTRIELSDVLKTLNKTEAYLRVRLARRFSVLGNKYNFRVFLNDVEIEEKDRDIYDHVQFLWAFDDESLERVRSLSPHIATVPDAEGNFHPCVEILPNIVKIPNEGSAQDTDGNTVEINASVRGFIASVFRPTNLGSREDSANALSIFANGRVFAENILGEANSAKYYQSYIVGEIHADFLDDDDVDRATASREAIKKDDPKYRALRGFALSTLESIGDRWDEWRNSQDLDATIESNVAVMEWLATLNDRRDYNTAKRLMTSIQNATVHSDEGRNAKAKAVLYRGAIIGFERLRLKQQLERLSAITDVLGPEFAAIFASLSDVEEAAYADITLQRLEIINKFKDIKDSPDDLEKVAQKYLFDHLWLLDPSWDRVTGRAEMEVTLTEHIKKVNPDSSGARLDISYRSSSGRHVVVELKRPKLRNLQFDDLSKQARKYRQSVEQYYRDKLPSKPMPPLDIYLLVAQTPVGMDEADRRAMAEQNSRIITYQQLITDASNAYQSYLDVKAKTGPLEAVLKKL